MKAEYEFRTALERSPGLCSLRNNPDIAPGVPASAGLRPFTGYSRDSNAVAGLERTPFGPTSYPHYFFNVHQLVGEHRSCVNPVGTRFCASASPSDAEPPPQSLEAGSGKGRDLSSVDFFAGSRWNAVSGSGSRCRSSAVCSALGRAADAQKRVPTIKSLHLRGRDTILVSRPWPA
jgi:hypothetical protein